jgi:hypothetical protein
VENAGIAGLQAKGDRVALDRQHPVPELRVPPLGGEAPASRDMSFHRASVRESPRAAQQRHQVASLPH